MEIHHTWVVLPVHKRGAEANEDSPDQWAKESGNDTTLPLFCSYGYQTRDKRTPIHFQSSPATTTHHSFDIVPSERGDNSALSLPRIPGLPKTMTIRIHQEI